MTLAYIPSPTISQFSIGPVTIHFYALCILLGIVLAVWMTTVHWKRYGGNFDQILDITLVAVPSGIIGARIYHIITTPERFFGPTGDWVEMFRIWNGGLGIWGGVLLGALAAWAWCRHKHYPMALLGDAVAPGLLVAQAWDVWATGSIKSSTARDDLALGFEVEYGGKRHRSQRTML